jgi:hypothetical protein
MLLRNEFDCGLKRVGLFENYPFSAKLVLTSRPRWIENSKTSPRHNYSWYVWNWGDYGFSRIYYLKKRKTK